MKILISLILFINILLVSLQSKANDEVHFNISSLLNEQIQSPTSLQFGPDGRLYVSQKNGLIWALSVKRDLDSGGNPQYKVTASEKIELLFNSKNRDDLGNLTDINNRLVTGIFIAGTEKHPIIYVSSSNPLAAGGKSARSSLGDTNSGVITKLERKASKWTRLDIVRGLPKSEENHGPHGLTLINRNSRNVLLVAQGGMTNKGAPSNNFVGLSEYYLSGAILEVDLDKLNEIPVSIDPRTNTQFIYDLPTLDDPTRLNINNTSKQFPYGKNHPMANASIDIGDPFGGNKGLNQAIIEPGGPVQILAPGFRNPYDLLVTSNRQLYTVDNGANAKWGGLPIVYTSNNQVKGTQFSSGFYPEKGDYISNDISERNDSHNTNPVHLIGNIDQAIQYYGGHPNPIRAFPNKAKIPYYLKKDNKWQRIHNHSFFDLLNNSSGYFTPKITSMMYQSKPEQAYHWSLGKDQDWPNILYKEKTSTNGLAEYTASNFNKSMQGDIIAASFNGSLFRYKLNENGRLKVREVLADSFGGIPLDLHIEGDNSPFPGTIWCATYGSSNITIFEPDESKSVEPDQKNKVPASQPNESIELERGIFSKGKNKVLTPIIRINSGGSSVYADDGGPHWQTDSRLGFQQYQNFKVSTGKLGSFPLDYSKKHQSIPDYISPAVYKSLFSSERWDTISPPNLEYSIPLPNGEYLINFYFGDGFKRSAKVGERQFKLNIEQKETAIIDPTQLFGRLSGGLVSYQTVVNDQELNLGFTSIKQNPLINAIEVLAIAPSTNDTPSASQAIKPSKDKPINHWQISQKHTAPSGRHEASLAKVGHYLVYFGGREPPFKVNLFNTLSSQWEDGGTLPRQLNHVQSITYAGLVWALGGFTNNQYPNETSQRFIFAYNPNIKEWFRVSEVPSKRQRGASGVAMHNDKFYILGGNTLGHQEGFVSYFDEYNPATNTWQILEDAPNARDHFHSIVLDNKLYAIGGRRTGLAHGFYEEFVDLVDVYDFTSKTWTTLPSTAKLPSPRAGFMISHTQKNPIVIGGENSQQAVNTVEMLDLQNLKWRTYTGLTVARHGAQAVKVNNQTLIIGGSPKRRAGTLKSAELINFSNETKTDRPTISNMKLPTINQASISDNKIRIIINNPKSDTANFLNQIKALNGEGKTLAIKRINKIVLPKTQIEITVESKQTLKSLCSLVLTVNNQQKIEHAINNEICAT